MATSISPSYDPPSTAAALAESYTSARQGILSTQTRQASATATALNALRSAISTYQASLSTLTSSKTLLRQSAAFSDPAIGSASAGATATAGSYTFFVERLARANQVSFGGLADSAADGGTLGISLGGAPAFTVNLSTADTNGNGTLTPAELAAAVNGASGNTALVSAALITINGAAQMVLTAKATGAASSITLDTSAVANAGLQSTLSNGANITQMVTGQDALVRLGNEGGTAIAQASNTFTNVAGVSMTFAKAQAAGETPVTLTIAADSAATTASVQSFVDAYNALKSVLAAMVASGDPAKGAASGTFAHDAGIRALHGNLVQILRQQAANGESLPLYGLTAKRDGSLSLDATRLTKQLAKTPNGLDTLIGSSAIGAASGIAGSLDSYLKEWNNSVDGQLKTRKDANDLMQKQLAARQARLDQQYDNAYQRYLKQYTQLQGLQSQMASNTSMFEALFSDNSD